MRPNQTKRLLIAGQSAIGTFCTAASSLLAETLGHAGYDFVIVDLQHGENSLANLQGMLQALSSTPTTPVVRVPVNSPVYIQRALDLGAYGVIVPYVNTQADAEAIVQSTRYAPEGARSWGPIRGILYGGGDYLARAKEELLTIVMLETAEGVKNAKGILATPGIDGCFIGPNDLSLSLGFPSEQSECPSQVEEAFETVLEACRATRKAGGIHVYNVKAANTRISQGFCFVSVMSDFRMVRAVAAETLGAITR